MVRMNGIDVDEFAAYVDGVRTDPTLADRDPLVVAHWDGDGARARVEIEGRTGFHLGGDDDFSAMQAIVAALAACDVEVVVNHATLLGLAITRLRVEATGHYNVASGLGVESPTDAAYQAISYRVVVEAPGATDDQLDRLKEACERFSPVGDTLRNAIPLRLEFEGRR